MSCGIGHRHSSDPMWLWLWCRLAATSLIWPLVWEPPYAAGAALKKKKNRSWIASLLCSEPCNGSHLPQGKIHSWAVAWGPPGLALASSPIVFPDHLPCLVPSSPGTPDFLPIFRCCRLLPQLLRTFAHAVCSAWRLFLHVPPSLSRFLQVSAATSLYRNHPQTSHLRRQRLLHSLSLVLT